MEVETCEGHPKRQTETAGIPPTTLRSALGGLLMGLAMLVPGVSGGTMILVMGLYEEFITAIADVTRLRFTRRNLTFLAIIGSTAFVAVAGLAGTLSRAVTLHQSAMFSLFIGLTLGGVPLLARMIAKVSPPAVLGVAVGLAAMVAIASTSGQPVDKQALKAAVARGEFVIKPAYARDVAAGALGMSSMVLPGISGAYMLLVLDRYDTILASVAVGKDYVLSLGGKGNGGECLRVIIPVAGGAIISLVLVSNLLKWVLRRYEKAALGVLLGILLGSVIGIWPFDATSQPRDYVMGLMLAAGGLGFTLSLSRISR